MRHTACNENQKAHYRVWPPAKDQNHRPLPIQFGGHLSGLHREKTFSMLCSLRLRPWAPQADDVERTSRSLRLNAY
jgi:hypothetical protein